MTNKYSHVFYMPTKKLKKKGLAPIYARIKCNKEEINVTTKIYAEVKSWKTNRFDPKASDGKSLNKRLDAFEEKLEELYEQIHQNYEHVSVQLLKHHLKVPIQTVTTLMQLLQKHLEHVEELIGNGYSQGTYRHYKSSKKHVQDFLIEKYKVKDFPIEKLSDAFINRFESFLASKTSKISKTGMIGQETINKECKRLKRALNYGIEMGWVKSFPFPLHKSKSSFTPQHPLTSVQLASIENVEVFGDYQTLCKDLFLFMCYTCLAYQDLMSFSQQDILQLASGRRIISKERGKTGNICEVLLSEKAEALIKKYSENPAAIFRKKIFTYVSNKTFNLHVKEIAKKAGIEMNVTKHIGRHTFATLSLENGMPIETLSKALGHSLIKTTQLYGKITRLKIEKDFISMEINSKVAA